jgi:hypothetical protein
MKGLAHTIGIITAIMLALAAAVREFTSSSYLNNGGSHGIPEKPISLF